MIGLFVAAALLLVGFTGPVHRPRCPDCGRKASRAIYMGLPVWFCLEHETAVAFGLLSELLLYLPFTGALYITAGPYLPGLWRWWKALEELEE